MNQVVGAFYEIRPQDVGRPTIHFHGRAWPVSNFIGRILPSDIGKRVYRRGDILQVENDEQHAARVGGARQRQIQLVNTWNGGHLGRRVVFTGTPNECFEWILKHTPFSFHEATTNQGYVLEEVATL